MTKLLVLSDSHGARDAIKRILNKEQNNVDAVIFLGDGLRDLEQALAFFPHLRVYSVAGNCDYGALEPLDGLAGFDQTVVFYTHGHMYGVKYDLDTLADAAAARGAEVALFGHSHIPHAEQRGNVFLFNPGSCGRCYTGPDTYGLLTLENGAYQSLIVNAERIAVGSGLQQENIFGMIDHNTHFRFPHFSILYLSFFQQYKFIIC